MAGDMWSELFWGATLLLYQATSRFVVPGSLFLSQGSPLSSLSLLSISHGLRLLRPLKRLHSCTNLTWSSKWVESMNCIQWVCGLLRARRDGHAASPKVAAAQAHWHLESAWANVWRYMCMAHASFSACLWPQRVLQTKDKVRLKTWKSTTNRCCVPFLFLASSSKRFRRILGNLWESGPVFWGPAFFFPKEMDIFRPKWVHFGLAKAQIQFRVRSSCPKWLYLTILVKMTLSGSTTATL